MISPGRIGIKRAQFFPREFTGIGIDPSRRRGRSRSRRWGSGRQGSRHASPRPGKDGLRPNELKRMGFGPPAIGRETGVVARGSAWGASTPGRRLPRRGEPLGLRFPKSREDRASRPVWRKDRATGQVEAGEGAPDGGPVLGSRASAGASGRMTRSHGDPGGSTQLFVLVLWSHRHGWGAPTGIGAGHGWPGSAALV